MVISDNTTYNHDQNTIVRLGNTVGLTGQNDVVMNYNSILQAGGNTVTIGSLTTQGGNGQLFTNVGTMGASSTGSTEIIENASATPGKFTINQTTPVVTEVKWDAWFRDGTVASHFFQPGQSQAGAALCKEVKAIKGELRSSGNGVYLSVGAIIIIVLLLILLL